MGKELFNRSQGETETREESSGLTMTQILTLPEPLRGLLSWMLRKGFAEFADVMAFLNQDEAAVRAILADLSERGFLRELESHGGTQYRVRLVPKRGRETPLNLWQALDDKTEK